MCLTLPQLTVIHTPRVHTQPGTIWPAPDSCVLYICDSYVHKHAYNYLTTIAIDIRFDVHTPRLTLITIEYKYYMYADNSSYKIR